MTDAKARATILRSIEIMGQDMEPSWETAANWSHVKHGMADLIVRFGSRLTQQDLALLLSVGALADRQIKRAVHDGGAA